MIFLRMVVVLLFVALTSCGTSDPTPQEFREKLDGVPSNSTDYELTVVQCVNDGEFVDVTWGLQNLTDERKTFAFDPVLVDLAGQEVEMGRELVGESVGSGEYAEWDSFFGGGERFPVGDVECRFEVVDSVLGAFRDED